MNESVPPGHSIYLRRFALPAVAIGVLLAVGYFAAHSFLRPTESTPAAPATGLSTEKGRLLFNVTLHTPEEIAGMLTRAEQLAATMRPDSRGTGIALVLHGPEIEIFAKKNYSRFRSTVDLAARLDGEQIIDVKICRTEMQSRGIKEEDLPAFIEVVPFGPEEIARLRREGYVYF